MILMNTRKYLKEGKYSIDEAEVLGAGSFGKVYRGYDHSAEKWVAIKQIDLKTLEKYGDEMKEIICNQISVMRKFTKNMEENPCQYLVKHEDCFRTDLFIYIIMELCDGGTLSEYAKKKNLSQPEVIQILRQLLIALAYLQGMSITHRDLKPENIFVAADQKDMSKIIVKIGDFGFSAQKQSFNQIMGTYPFMAPEIFQREQYTSKVDVWALGIIAYEIIFNELYFKGKAKWDIEKQVKQLPFFISQQKKGRISKDLQEFIGSCLVKDKNARMKASELLKSTLFQKLVSKVNITVFDIIAQEVDYCSSLQRMAELFAVFQEKTNKKTEFVQMYLLKQSLSIINLITYSVMNKLNYLNLQQNHYLQLINEKNSQKYQALNQKVQSTCIIVTEMFNQKYEMFKEYIQRFNLEEKSMINKVITAQPYEKPHQTAFKNQLKKWKLDLQKNNVEGKWNNLLSLCQIQCSK